MTLKPLRQFIQRCLAILDSATRGGLTLYGAKDMLEQLDKEYAEQTAKSPDRLVLADRTEPNQVKTWTTGDGSRIEVGCMTDQHLFYALAKARRGEYPDSHARATGIEALELEAFRRLRNKLVVPTVDSTAMKRKPLDCAFCHGHFVHYAHCPTLLH